MGGWLEGINHWHWFALGVVLVILEMFSPAAYFLWLGIGAGLTGFLLLLWPELGWPQQLLAFAILAVLSVGLGRRYLKLHPIKTDKPTLNRRGEQYVGRVFTLEEPIVNGLGKIRVDDSTWKISGDDCAAGARVKVTGVDGVVLEVEPNP
jgi:membrane protein implicated in regulation of membrane protease activity